MNGKSTFSSICAKSNHGQMVCNLLIQHMTNSTPQWVIWHYDILTAGCKHAKSNVCKNSSQKNMKTWPDVYPSNTLGELKSRQPLLTGAFIWVAVRLDSRASVWGMCVWCPDSAQLFGPCSQELTVIKCVQLRVNRVCVCPVNTVQVWPSLCPPDPIQNCRSSTSVNKRKSINHQ